MPKFKLKVQLKPWEISFIVLALIVSAMSFSAYVLDFPIRKYLFNLVDEQGQTLIGEVQTKTGSLKRQLSGETAFKNVSEKDPLYNMDVIVTGPDSSAILLLESEGTIEIGPNSMVRLAFETDLTLDGIDRVNKLNVISGHVKSQAGKKKIVITSKEGSTEVKPNTNHTIEVKAAPIKPAVPTPLAPSTPVAAVEKLPPVPSPSPVPAPSPTLTKEQADKIKILTPKKGERLTIDEKASRIERPVKLSWTMNPPNAKTQVRIWRVNHSGKNESSQRDLVLERVFPTQKGLGAIVWKAKHPGNYEWEIAGENGEKISFDENTHSHFSIFSEVQGIKALQPLISGKTTVSNQFNGEHLKEFDIKLRWNPYPTAEKYRVQIYSTPTAKAPVIDKTIKQTELSFNKDQLVSGKFFYKITSVLDSGFTANSGLQEFSFSFLPPAPALPRKNSIITQKRIRSDGNYVVLTWKKTNFTRGYEIEIGKDPQFKQIYLKKVLKENYFVLKNPALGQYWWRVRGFAKNLSSPLSEASVFTIAP
jgi:hypothetical protein